MKFSVPKAVILTSICAVLSGCSHAPHAANEKPSKSAMAESSAKSFKDANSVQSIQDVAKSPLRDFGLMKVRIPAPFESMSNPYALRPDSCAALLAELGELETILGPDAVPTPQASSQMQKAASQAAGRVAEEAGGKKLGTAVNNAGNAVGKSREFAYRTAAETIGGLNPARGIVRSISGASKHEAKLNDAIDMGLMRRAYLRGVADERPCEY